MAISKKKSASKKKSGVTIDFTGVESGFDRVPEGDYVLEVTKATIDNSGDSEHDYVAWTYKIVGGSKEGKTIGDITSFAPKALFRLKNLLEAMGAEIPDGDFEFEPDDWIGQTVGATVTDEEYNGKTRSRPSSYFDASDVSEEEPGEEEEEEAEEEESDEEESEEEESEEEEEEESEEEESDSWSEGDAVSFKMGKKVLKGKITGFSDDGDFANVKVGKEEYEVEIENLIGE